MENTANKFIELDEVETNDPSTERRCSSCVHRIGIRERNRINCILSHSKETEQCEHWVCRKADDCCGLCAYFYPWTGKCVLSFTKGKPDDKMIRKGDVCLNFLNTLYKASCRDCAWFFPNKLHNIPLSRSYSGNNVYALGWCYERPIGKSIFELDTIMICNGKEGMNRRIGFLSCSWQSIGEKSDDCCGECRYLTPSQDRCMKDKIEVPSKHGRCKRFQGVSEIEASKINRIEKGEYKHGIVF